MLTATQACWVVSMVAYLVLSVGGTVTAVDDILRNGWTGDFRLLGIGILGILSSTAVLGLQLGLMR